jgi:hypothetical protein
MMMISVQMAQSKLTFRHHFQTHLNKFSQTCFCLNPAKCQQNKFKHYVTKVQGAGEPTVLQIRTEFYRKDPAAPVQYSKHYKQKMFMERKSKRLRKFNRKAIKQVIPDLNEDQILLIQLTPNFSKLIEHLVKSELTLTEIKMAGTVGEITQSSNGC